MDRKMHNIAQVVTRTFFSRWKLGRRSFSCAWIGCGDGLFWLGADERFRVARSVGARLLRCVRESLRTHIVVFRLATVAGQRRC